MIFFKTKLLMINLWSISCSILPYMLRIKKKQWKISNYFINFFLKLISSFCVNIYFVSWCMYWIIAYFYILDIIYIKDKISVTLLHVDANYASWIFSICFSSICNHLNSIYFCEVPNYSFELNVCLSVCPSDEKHFFFYIN